MITLSEFIKVFPDLKDSVIYYKILGEVNPFPKDSNASFRSVWYGDFVKTVDFKRLQLIKCEVRYIGCECGNNRYFLTLRKLPKGA